MKEKETWFEYGQFILSQLLPNKWWKRERIQSLILHVEEGMNTRVEALVKYLLLEL